MTVEVELPAVWLDQVVLDDLGLAPGAPFQRVLNRIPEPGAINVRTDSSIWFDLAIDGSDNFVTLWAWVSINGAPEVQVFDATGGGYAPGWDGPEGGFGGIDTWTYRFGIDPTTDFDSLDQITVRILAETSLGFTLAESWSFTIEDVTSPVVVSATPAGPALLRVVFDELINPTELGTFAIERLTAPAVNVVVVSVTPDTSSSVLLELDIEMTPGAGYRVTAVGTEDPWGNVVTPPDDVALFTGYQPRVPANRSWDLWRMIPRKNRDEDPGDLQKFIACLQEVSDLQLSLIDAWTDIIDPDKAPERFVDAMLVDLGNPFRFDLDLGEKRRLIRILVPIYKQKGTAVGIVNAVRFFLGVEVTINAFASEGWVLGEDELGDSGTDGTAILGPGTSFNLYSFEVVSPVGLTAEQRSQIIAIARYMKPGHTHLIRIVEPTLPDVFDHLELGISELGVTWFLH